MRNTSFLYYVRQSSINTLLLPRVHLTSPWKCRITWKRHGMNLQLTAAFITLHLLLVALYELKEVSLARAIIIIRWGGKNQDSEAFYFWNRSSSFPIENSCHKFSFTLLNNQNYQRESRTTPVTRGEVIRSLLHFYSKVNFLTVGVKAGLTDRNTCFSVSIFDIEN